MIILSCIVLFNGDTIRYPYYPYIYYPILILPYCHIVILSNSNSIQCEYHHISISSLHTHPISIQSNNNTILNQYSHPIPSLHYILSISYHIPWLSFSNAFLIFSNHIPTFSNQFQSFFNQNINSNLFLIFSSVFERFQSSEFVNNFQPFSNLFQCFLKLENWIRIWIRICATVERVS